MRIAYIAPYHGPTVVKRRPIIRNLSLAAQVKIAMLAELLQRSSHSVEILSQGEVVERQFAYYPGFRESDGEVPVFYSSAFPVRFVNGVLSSVSLLQLFKRRHRVAPFDAVFIYNLKPPQITCANYAIRRLGLPVILDYEDDAFRGVWGNNGTNLTSRYYASAAKRLLGTVSGCIAVSPFLLSQTRTSIPKLLLRGIVSDPVVALSQARNGSRKNWVVFSGTHERSQGLEQMIKAWRMLEKSDWQLHIAGKGAITKTLHDLAENDPTIVFHGLLNRKENADLVCKAKIGMNPQDPPSKPGTVFAFKIIEYLAAGLHVITTPRGELEKELEAGITYIPDNSPEAIAQGLRVTIEHRRYERSAQQAALLTYGPNVVEASLNKLLEQVVVPSAKPSSAYVCT